MEKDDLEVALVKISCEINPLTAELAQEIHDFVRRTLFTMDGVEVNSLLNGCSFALAMPPQAIQVRMAPDTKKPSFTLDETKVGDFKARRSKKSSAWTWTFTVTCSPASEHQLAQIMECYTRTKYLTFAPAEPGLFDDAPTASRGLTAAEQADEVDQELVEDVSDEATAH
jgi:hypothetical protein